MATLSERYKEHVLEFDYFPKRSQVVDKAYSMSPPQYNRPVRCSEGHMHNHRYECGAFPQSMSSVLIMVNGEFYKMRYLTKIEELKGEELELFYDDDQVSNEENWVKVDLGDWLLSEVICPCGYPDTNF